LNYDVGRRQLSDQAALKWCGQIDDFNASKEPPGKCTRPRCMT
jgi:hypothetical protein